MPGEEAPHAPPVPPRDDPVGGAPGGPVENEPALEQPEHLPTIAWNDNTAAAGVWAGQSLAIRLEVVRGRWHVTGPEQPAGEVLAFGAVGKAPSNPGPMIRVPLGTSVRANVTYRHDRTIVVHGLASRRGARMDSLVIPAGETREARFTADVEGTFYYWGAEAGTSFDDRVYHDSQLNGAFVVDPAGTAGRPADRVLVVTRWVQNKDSDGEPDVWGEFFAINGRPWPLTERFTYDVGDSVHWRWINASDDVHPLHLHGFYFRVDSRGDVQRDTLYWEGQRLMGVTERVEPSATMATSSELGRYNLTMLEDLNTTYPFLQDNAAGPFVALRSEIARQSGWDLLADLENAFIPITEPPNPGGAGTDQGL